MTSFPAKGVALSSLSTGEDDHYVPQQCNADGAAPAPVQRQSSSASSKTALLLPTRSVGIVIGGLVFLALLVGIRWIDLDAPFLLGNASRFVRGTAAARGGRSSSATLIPIPLDCGNLTSPPVQGPSLCRRRPTSPPPPPPSSTAAPSCPDYFRHIHSDLEPWRESGITLEAVQRARRHANFRLVVVGGRAYVENYGHVYETRDVFTQWGILQLLARYPGRVPDLDLMFSCGDMPGVRKAAFPSPADAPPLFLYCKDGSTMEVVFPDWSFWGWPEVNIRPWAPLLAEMTRENALLRWPEREPYAYYKGNPTVSPARADLFLCNSSGAGAGEEDWKARLFAQDWKRARRSGFKGSNLAEQCRYRYKIYVQGRSWSVSEKYILACDSPMLAIETPFVDFFSRGLVAGEHYWPIDPAHKCASIKYAVDWGNANPAEAQRMGEAGSGFAREEMGMDRVYDYMLHVLTQYAGLLRYKPAVPEKAVELCLESMACPARGRLAEFLMESRERHVAGHEPCTLPLPFTAEEAAEMARRNEEVRSKVRKMEQSKQLTLHP